MAITTKLYNKGLITPPTWLPTNIILEIIGGSRLYGANVDNSTDYDIRGIFIPPKDMIFHSSLIYGFDIYNITKFMKLGLANNPNQIDMLFCHETDITHCTQAGRMILDNRHIFLSKLSFIRFRGYAASQFKSIKNGRNAKGKRKELIEKYSYDTKYAMHLIRLMNEATQILSEENIDLKRGSEEYRAIRTGQWSYEKLEKEFNERKLQAEKAYTNSKLPEIPNYNKIKNLLLNCLEQQYGSLKYICPQPDFAINALKEIDLILQKNRSLIYN
jgi:predicted nucleotidyltransferase